MFSLSGFELYSDRSFKSCQGISPASLILDRKQCAINPTELLIICNGLKAEVTMPATVMF